MIKIAQSAAPADESAKEDSSEIIVTGSRVVANGNDMPTPTTVVSIADIEKANPGTVADQLAGLVALAARGATVYVTLEPCSHVGKSPPCVPSSAVPQLRQTCS